MKKDIKKPSVSELLRLLDKPALLGWANRQGLKGIDISKERSKWLNAGTSIHNQIENFVRKGEPFISQEAQENYKKFINDKDVISVEMKIETEYFTGIYDMALTWNNKKYIIDFKRKAKRIYLEHKLQLVAYSMAEPCDGMAIVSVPDFRIMNFNIEDKEPYIEILKSLSNIYKLKKIIENGRI